MKATSGHQHDVSSRNSSCQTHVSRLRGRERSRRLKVMLPEARVPVGMACRAILTTGFDMVDTDAKRSLRIGFQSKFEPHDRTVQEWQDRDERVCESSSKDEGDELIDY
jgi:hypothetical protein